ncbi:hypothetical protein [Halovenus marina]|uniref:hypothetical protein n=1 Tax=Halovenus marina TaxID=3396621 RepID=UPI003F571737
MTGFKSGASDDDPLAADDTVDQNSNEDQPNLQTESSTDTSPSDTSTGNSKTELPWIYQRNSITDGRPKTVQLHLQQQTFEREQESLSNVPIDETVNKADLREAAYLVGLQNLDEVGEQLRDWGYDLK